MSDRSEVVWRSANSWARACGGSLFCIWMHLTSEDWKVHQAYVNNVVLMFYISTSKLDHLQVRWPVLRSEGDKSRNYICRCCKICLTTVWIICLKDNHLWQNRRKHLACLEAWFHKEVVDMRPGLFTAILVKYLPTFEVNFMLKLFSFPLILKRIHKHIIVYSY